MSHVLITGASRGIGLELARQAAARGDTVTACARDPETPALLGEPALRREALDVTDPAGPEALAARLSAAPPIDLLVCNAGVYHGRGRIDDDVWPPEAWAETFAVNVTGVFLTVRALRPRLARGGRIAIVSSRMGSNANARGGSYIYRASKAAATNLASNLAVDLAAEGIAVASYHPGWVRTDMGSASADISTEESAAGLLARFDALSMANTGAFESFDGTPIAF